MARIIKQDTDGTKPLLDKGEFGYDDYVAGGDEGRVYVGNGTSNVPLARQSEISNIDNTSDADKPVSTAGQTALDLKADKSTTYTQAELAGAIGNINSPLLDLPLKNNLSMKAGTGSVNFSRATTATYIDRYGVLQYAGIDEPRFEKDGLLIEGASINLLKSSNEPTNTAYWSATVKNFHTWTFNTSDIVSPDGTNNATKVVHSSASLTARQNTTFTGGLAYTASMWLYIPTQVGITSFTVFIDYQYTLNSQSATYTEFDKWVRISITTTLDADKSWIDYAVRYNGGMPAGGEIAYVYGFQAEELPFASSYIPTTSSAVTRSTDDCRVTSKYNIPNLNEYTVSVESDTFGWRLFNNIFVCFDSSVDSTYLRYYEAPAGNVGLFFGGGGKQIAGGLSIAPNTVTNIAVVFDNGNIALYGNGILIGSISEATIEILDLMQELRIGNSTYPTWGHIKNFKIFDKALTPTEINLLQGTN